MPTVVKTIGSGSGRDYSTLAGWAASLPPNLVSDGNSYQGNCYNDSEFVGSTNLLKLSGHITDATHTITLTTGAGQSFRDNANVQGNALRYNQANGVGIRTTGNYSIDTPIICSDSNVFFSNLQVKASGNAYGINLDDASGITVTVDDCIFTANNRAACVITGAGSKLRNSLIYTTGNPGTAPLECSTINGVNNPSLYFCTIVSASDATAPTAAVKSQYGSVSFENCAFFGCTAVGSGSSSFTFTNCMTDVTSPPAGCTGGKTFANQFQNTTVVNGDWRAKAGADLEGAATADTTNGGTDIAGTARPQSGMWDIGCWELLGSGTAVTIDLGLPVELLARQPGEPPGLLEYLANPRSDIGAALEALASQRGKNGLTLGVMTAQRADPGLAIELLLARRLDPELAIELLLARRLDPELAIELLLARRLDPELALESATLLRAETAWSVELGGRIATAASGPVELSVNVARDWVVAIEWVVSLLRDAAASGESAAGVAADLPSPEEWLGVLAVLISDDAFTPIEWTVLGVSPLVSLERLLASPGKRRILSSPGRLRLLGRS